MTGRLPGHDDGMSPVMATLLLVAISVLLGAAVYVIATQLSEGPAPAPTAGFVRDPANGELDVLRADPDMRLSTLRVSLSRAGHAAFGPHAGLASTAAPAGAFVGLAGATGALEPGEQLSFCVDAPGGPVTVTVRDQATNALLFTGTFLALPTCA